MVSVIAMTVNVFLSLPIFAVSAALRVRSGVRNDHQASLDLELCD